MVKHFEVQYSKWESSRQMTHQEFVEKCNDPEFVWGIRRFYGAVYHALRLSYFALCILIICSLLPVIVKWTLHRLESADYAALLWLVPCLLSLSAYRPRSFRAAFIFFLTAVSAGGILGFFFGMNHLLGPFFVFIFWFTTRQIERAGMNAIEQRLKESNDLYETLRDNGILFIHTVEPVHAVDVRAAANRTGSEEQTTIH